jgi:hypothetical protein
VRCGEIGIITGTSVKNLIAIEIRKCRRKVMKVYQKIRKE